MFAGASARKTLMMIAAIAAPSAPAIRKSMMASAPSCLSKAMRPAPLVSHIRLVE
jgi:hypothetical protein